MLNMDSWYTSLQHSIFLVITSLLFTLFVQSATHGSVASSDTYKPSFELDHKQAEHYAQLEKNQLQTSTPTYYASCQVGKHQSTVTITSDRNIYVTRITTPDRVKAITISPDEQLISLACRRKTKYDDHRLQSELVVRTYNIQNPLVYDIKIVVVSPLKDYFFIETFAYNSDDMLTCTYLPYNPKTYLNLWLTQLDTLQNIASKKQVSRLPYEETLASIQECRGELKTYTMIKPSLQRPSSCIIL